MTGAASEQVPRPRTIPNTSVTPLLAVDGLGVRTAAGRLLVHDVSFTLARGQTLGIVGESGSGKSVTARSIMRVLPRELVGQGSVRFDGIELFGRRERSLRPLRGTRMSMVLQDPFTALNPLQSIGEHLRESLAKDVRGRGRTARAEVAQRLEEVGLDSEAVAGKYPFQLSGGMRQRVAIAAALAGDPDLLIADEPTTALDVTTQAEVLALLRRLQAERGMALVLITHDLRVAFAVCNRILVMYAGRVVEDAPAASLVNGPQHPYTLGLLLADPPLDRYANELVSIPGNVPPAAAVVARCGFADRCRWTEPVCVAGRPPLVPTAADHASACIRIGSIRQDLRRAAGEIPSGTPPPEIAVSAPLLAVRDLAKVYRTKALTGKSRVTTALSGVSLEVGEGESVGLVGETGSGKTTVARCVLGLTTADGGTITIRDVDISRFDRLSTSERRRVRRMVQAVFQDPYASLNPSFTVGATLSEAIGAAGRDVDSFTVDELLQLVGLPATYASRRPAVLSGGERQRVAIARAIALRPRLLICDEPVAALDVSVQAQILELLRSIRRSLGTSMLFITHDLAVVRQMTERVIVLRGGEVVERGSTTDVLERPRHAYTIKLIESVPGAR